MRHPQILGPDDLDLSGLREHCRAMHKSRPLPGRRQGAGLPRSNADLAGWHWGQHWRYHLGHLHFGPWTLVRSRHTGSTVGMITRPLGWWTGQDAVTREQLDAEFRERMRRNS